MQLGDSASGSQVRLRLRASCALSLPTFLALILVPRAISPLSVIHRVVFDPVVPEHLQLPARLPSRRQGRTKP